MSPSSVFSRGPPGWTSPGIVRGEGVCLITEEQIDEAAAALGEAINAVTRR